MKKTVLILFAAGFMVACNSSADSAGEAIDSAGSEMTDAAQSAAAALDSTAGATADTLSGKVEAAVDSLKK